MLERPARRADLEKGRQSNHENGADISSSHVQTKSNFVCSIVMEGGRISQRKLQKTTMPAEVAVVTALIQFEKHLQVHGVRTEDE